MTAKEEAFARAVAEGRTLREAYRGAYDTSRMKDGTVDRKAQEVLHKPHVAAYVARLEEDIRASAEAECVMSAVEVLHELTEIASGRGRYPTAAPGSGELISVPANVGQRIKALELLGKHHKLFTDRCDIGTDKPFEVNITVLEEGK